jgi:hypothetical protein
MNADKIIVDDVVTSQREDLTVSVSLVAVLCHGALKRDQ